MILFFFIIFLDPMANATTDVVSAIILPESCVSLIASHCTISTVARLVRTSKEFQNFFAPILAEMVAGLYGMPTPRQRQLLATEYKDREARAWRYLQPMLRELSSTIPEAEDELRLSNLNRVAWWLRPL